MRLPLIVSSLIVGSWACSSDDSGGGGGAAGTGGTGGAGGADAAVDAVGEASPDAPADVVEPEPRLGAACESDADCSGRAPRCLKPGDDAWNVSAFSGPSGPAGGYCSASCAEFEGTDAQVDPCLALGGTCYLGWCLEACTMGLVESPAKCHGRSDVTCMPSTGGEGDVCYPTCTPASDCGPGRECDPRSSRCKSPMYIVPGAPDGAACEVGGSPTCAAQCVRVSAPLAGGASAEVGVCGSRCVTSAVPDGCGPMKACLYAPTGAVAGDRGYCAQLCDDVSDCLDTVHEVVCNPGTVAALGHGYCEVVGPIRSTDGGVDGAAGAPSDAGVAEAGDAAGD